MQSSIAVLISILLLTLLNGPKRHRRTRLKHVQALLTSSVEFHKDQCYFAGAMQIASIAYITGSGAFGINFVNIGFQSTIATNGFVPTTFVLVLVSRYGRQSWYLILLSLMVLLLSTVPLVSVSLYGEENNLVEYLMDSVNITSCGSFHAREVLASWCGTDKVFANYGLNTKPEGVYLWTIWTHSFVWLLYCIYQKVRTGARLQMMLPSFIKKVPRIRDLRWGKAITRILQCLFIIAWSCSFGYQFYLYSLIFAQSTVNTQWTFGQIIAVAVWAPSLVEYFNLEISTFNPLFNLVPVQAKRYRWHSQGLRI